jgi:PEP-CTERM/exosortase A-associated glycosyltransferase
MRILHIFDHSIPLHSGYTFRSRSILEHQRATGWETYHLTSPKHNLAARPTADQETVDGLEFFRTEVPRGWMSNFSMLNPIGMITALAARLENVARMAQPDVLHAHSPALNGEAAIRVGQRLKIPVVYEVRAFWEDAAVDHGTSKEWGLRYRLTRALETRVFRRADAITTICEGLRDEIILRAIPDNKITVIPNAVDLTHFAAGTQRDVELARRLRLQDMKVLGFIGSFYAYEGLVLLLYAMPQIVKEEPKTRLLLVGGGPQEHELKRVARELGLENKVIFVGRVPHDEVQRYYDLVDIFVYPRLRMRLTELVTPLKPLEAMAQGRLVLASNVGGHRELIRDGKTGVLFRAGDSEALGRSALALLQTPEMWPGLRDAGRQFVETERNWKASVARYESVYDRLVAPGRSPRRMSRMQ